VVYRLYTPEDFAQLYAIEEVCFEHPFRFGRQYMRHLVDSSDAATWIAEEDGRMVGFSIAEWGREQGKRIAYLQTIEVTPEARGGGVGAELLRLCEDSARVAGAQRIWLHVDAENESAIRLYQRNRYVFEGRQENYYPRGRAALIAAKALGQAAAWDIGPI
jgi:ribosomal protein S18 acetylase RimI-like enzyme